MFLHKRVPMWTLVAVVVGVLVLFGIGSAIHSAGWSDGFTMGLLASGGTEGGTVAPYLAYRSGPGWHHGGFGGFFGGFFRFLFFLFVIALIFKFLGFWRWRMHGAHAPWGHHGWHTPRQPWPHQGGPAGGSEQPTGDKPEGTTTL